MIQLKCQLAKISANQPKLSLMVWWEKKHHRRKGCFKKTPVIFSVCPQAQPGIVNLQHQVIIGVASVIWASWPFRAMSDTIASSLLRKIETFHAEPPIWLIEKLQTPRWTLWDLGSLYRFTTSSQREPSMPWSYDSLFAHLDCLESFGFGNAPGVGTDTCQLHSLRNGAQRIITAPYFGPRESFHGSENYSRLIHNAWILLDDTWHS